MAHFANQDKVSLVFLDLIHHRLMNWKILHCVSFATLGKANTKKSKGLHATGIGSVSCACHKMYQSNSMGDLQKGEWYMAQSLHLFSYLLWCFRYANMDYLFFASLVGITL